MIPAQAGIQAAHGAAQGAGQNRSALPTFAGISFFLVHAVLQSVTAFIGPEVPVRHQLPC